MLEVKKLVSIAFRHSTRTAVYYDGSPEGVSIANDSFRTARKNEEISFRTGAGYGYAMTRDRALHCLSAFPPNSTPQNLFDDLENECASPLPFGIPT